MILSKIIKFCHNEIVIPIAIFLLFAGGFYSYYIYSYPWEDYDIVSSLDLSSGRYVSQWINKESKVIKTVQNSMYDKLYKQYDLSYPEQLLTFNCSTRYKFTYFHFDMNNELFRFWKWELKFFTALPTMHADGFSPYSSFGQLLTEGIPKQDAQKIFIEAIKLYKSNANDETVQAFFYNLSEQYMEPTYQNYWTCSLLTNTQIDHKIGRAHV